LRKRKAGTPEAGAASLYRQSRAERLLLWFRRMLPAPFELLKDRGHALVRAEFRRTRLGRWAGSVLCVLPPLLVLEFLVLANRASNQKLGAIGYTLAGMTVCFWPLVMFTGAALASAMAVLAERSQDTAAQIVLTAMPKRALAAAKVLPYVGPFLWGSLAAVPLYMAAGSSGVFLSAGFAPTPLVVWPLRSFAAFAMPWSLCIDFSPEGYLAGALMGLTDLGAVWMAAHWGAGLAVRMGRLPLVGWRLTRQLGRTLLVYAAYALSGYVIFLVSFMAITMIGDVSHQAEGIAARVAFLPAAAGFLFLWWIYPLADASSSALEDFAWFDWLAMDEFDPRRREQTHNWQAWKDVSARP